MGCDLCKALETMRAIEEGLGIIIMKMLTLGAESDFLENRSEDECSGLETFIP